MSLAGLFAGSLGSQGLSKPEACLPSKDTFGFWRKEKRRQGTKADRGPGRTVCQSTAGSRENLGSDSTRQPRPRRVGTVALPSRLPRGTKAQAQQPQDVGSEGKGVLLPRPGAQGFCPQLGPVPSAQRRRDTGQGRQLGRGGGEGGDYITAPPGALTHKGVACPVLIRDAILGVGSPWSACPPTSRRHTSSGWRERTGDVGPEAVPPWPVSPVASTSGPWPCLPQSGWEAGRGRGWPPAGGHRALPWVLVGGRPAATVGLRAAWELPRWDSERSSRRQASEGQSAGAVSPHGGQVPLQLCGVGSLRGGPAPGPSGMAGYTAIPVPQREGAARRAWALERDF